MYTFISKPKPPVTVYYTGKHVSRVFEDLRKTKAPNNEIGYLVATLCLICIHKFTYLPVSDDGCLVARIF
jgi:hypothetical protein